MIKHKKHILNAAKDNISNKYRAQLEAIDEKLSSIYASHENITHDNQTACGMCLEVDTLRKESDRISEEWYQFGQQGKANKKKLGKRVNWTADRESAPTKKVDHSALQEFRSSRKAKNTTQVGVDWLHEGALVTKRGRTEMMIVTQVRDKQVQVLDQGQERWYRNTQLRPADWLLED